MNAGANTTAPSYVGVHKRGRGERLWIPTQTRGRLTPRALARTNERGAAMNVDANTRKISQALTCINEGRVHKQGEQRCEDTDAREVGPRALTCTNDRGR